MGVVNFPINHWRDFHCISQVIRGFDPDEMKTVTLLYGQSSSKTTAVSLGTHFPLADRP